MNLSLATSQVINPAAILKSGLSLVAAITCTDAIRDCINVAKGRDPSATSRGAAIHVAAAIILIFCVMYFISFVNSAHGDTAVATQQATAATTQQAELFQQLPIDRRY